MARLGGLQRGDLFGDRQGVAVASVLEQMEQSGRDVAIVIGRDKKYRGMVSQDALIEKVKAKATEPYREAFLPDVKPIPAGESLSNVLGLVAGSRWPVPVVDDEGRYVGSLSKSSLLETLDRAG